MTGVITGGRARWAWRVGVVATLVAVPCAVSRPDLVRALVVMAAVGLLFATARFLRRGHWTALASAMLPPGERECWRAEVAAVLHAAGDGRERRRQRRGFLLSLPSTVVTGWRTALVARRARR